MTLMALRKRAANMLWALVLSLTACGGSEPSGSPVPQLEWTRAVLETRDGKQVPVDRSWLTVPESHDATESPTIELPVMRLEARGGSSGTPIVLLSGGPGTPGIASVQGDWNPEADRGATFRVVEALLEFGDVVVIDQRGSGFARPNLQCAVRWDLPLDRRGTREQLLERASELARVCRSEWQRAGVDLDAYNTVENANDLEALRRALSVETINLVGGSYASHLIIAYLRRYGNRVGWVVMNGIEGPDHTIKLPSTIQRQMEEIHARVTADPAVSRAVPDFLGLVEAVLARLERQPVTVELENAETGEPVRVVAGAWDLKKVTADGLGNDDFIQRLPARYDAMSRGDYRWLGEATLARRTRGYGNAMYYAMDCASYATAARLEHIRTEAPQTLLGDLIDLPLPYVCDAWGVPDLGDGFRSNPRSDVPILIVSGTLDGRTPVANGEEVLERFPNGHHLIVDGAAHGTRSLLTSSPQILDALREFIRSGRPSLTRVEIPFKFERPGA